MATANTVQLQLGQWPEYYRPGISNESTKKVSDLLQENHEKYHIFFNNEGFHNHIAHQLLTMWALKASPDQLQREYTSNSSYQRPMMAPHTSIITDLHDPKKFIQNLGPEDHYNDYLQFFHAEIEKKGWQQVLQQYLFAGDERAETMLVRMYAGFLHPLIHLGFGIEFHQPAIIAEALAQAACHDDWIKDLFFPAEKAAASNPSAGTKPIASILDSIRASKDIRSSVRFTDGNKIRDGLLARAPEAIINQVSQVRVSPSDLAEKTAEMINSVAYYTGGSQNPSRAIKFDFFMMHSVNCSIFHSAFLKQDWLSDANKARLLEWKIRLDLVMYASRGSPEIRMQDIKEYKPKQPSGWEEVQDRVCAIDDDGHAAKLVRAIAHGAVVCEPYEGKEAFRLKGQDWLQLAHMAIDSVEGPESNWVRSAGFEEAWENVPMRASL